MLQLLRRYQRYIFFFITIIIILSFSFFGTYSALDKVGHPDKIAFKAVDGSSVSVAELEAMTLFLRSDSNDKLLSGGIWGPNFLNDGVVRKDLMQTGIATILASQNKALIQDELNKIHEREKQYKLYQHPQSRSINTENIWRMLAPEMMNYYKALTKAQDPLSEEAFNARAYLFTKEKNLPNERGIPSNHLKRMLMMQQQQYASVKPDPRLPQMDLALFGHHTVDDWFGSNFTRLAAEFIINSAKIAEKRGLVVSKQEALADLLDNADESFKQNNRNTNLGVRNSNDYFNEQLRIMGMDRNAAVKVWQQVMLFRRLFHDVGSSVLVDPYTVETFNAYAHDGIEGTRYSLPKALQLGQGRDLQKFEVYLNAVSDRKGKGAQLLDMPTTFRSAQEIVNKYPELVQKRYVLEIASADKKTIQTRIGIKEMWNWEVSDKNWSKLEKDFPELGIKNAKTRDERFAALDALDEVTRTKLDTQARAAIAEEHPEWLEQALNEAPVETRLVSITPKGGNNPLPGIENRSELLTLLDAAPLSNEKGQEPNAKAKAAQEKLQHYSSDKQNFFRISVVERSSGPEILTFEEANKSGALEEITNRQLSALYEKIRDKKTDAYKNSDGSWKQLAEVNDSIAADYLSRILQALGTGKDQSLNKAAAMRMQKHLADVQARIRANPEAREALVSRNALATVPEGSQIPTRAPLADQWKLVEGSYTLDKNSNDPTVDVNEALKLDLNAWSKVYTPANGDAFFFIVTGKGTKLSESELAKRVAKAQQVLAYSAQRSLMNDVIKEIKEKGAFNLDFLNRQQSNEPEME